ncbi:MAG: hypothetical protein ACOYJ8_02495 [Patescibacteria group bacterium]|jgi:hypothetical protein
MANKKFLEEYPLYRKFLTELKTYHRLSDIPKPSIHMHCKQCQSGQTFNMVNEYNEIDYYSNNKIPGIVIRLKYKCTGCHNYIRYFLVHFATAEIEVKNDKGEKEYQEVIYMEKVGQYPAWSIEMDKELEEILGDHAEYYKRGLICESQSYGIGAYAYFRRVTEDVVDDLLELILDLVEEDEQEKYKEKLEEAKKEKVAEKKINLVKDLLPKSLQVEGVNPLKELYRVLSKGVHNKTDEECMEKAEAIRGILVFLVNQVIRTKKDKKSFTEGMKKILNSK